MRIAVVHSFYRSNVPSGENDAVLRQVAALTAAGHDVALIERRSDQAMRNPLFALESGYGTMTGRGPSPLAELHAFRPDVIHVHNLFPNFGTAWLSEIRTPVVNTMHNYRAICANGLLFRDGASCLDCPSGHPWSAVRHRCYHDSAIATLPLAIRNSRGIGANALLQASRRVVFLNRPAADLFISLGLDRDKAVVIPNGVADDASRPAAVGGERFLVAARLTREKGVFELAQQWPDEHLLDVAGQGPESQRIASLQKPNIRLLGQLPNDLLRQSLPEYAGIVVPSICSEMQPTIAIEAMAASVPVVAYTANVASQLVKDDDVGAIYWGAESLTAALNHVLGNQARLKDSARATFAARFSESAWTQRLVDLYSEARVQ